MKKIFLLAILTTLSMWAAGNTLSSELLAKYYKSTTVTAESGTTLNKITINGPSTPPPSIERVTVNALDLEQTAATNTLIETPAFEWSFGCAATSGAMIAGYYDRTGYVDVYSGPTNGGLMELNNSVWGTMVDSGGDTRAQCPLSATRNGVDGRTTNGHVDDYWIKYNSTAQDPYIGNWAQHTYDDCTGDFMKTNQSAYGNSDGATSFYFYPDGTPLTAEDLESAGPNYYNYDGAYGLKLFFESRGYTVTALYSQRIDANVTTGGFAFADYKAEIDAGHPVLIHVAGHTMAGVGYNDTGNTVYLHDTWDYDTHSMVWGDSYAGMKHFGVTVINLDSNESSNQPPTADAGPDKTTQVNQSITITGSGTDTDGTIASYEWKEGTTILSNSDTFNYTPTTTGNHTLTLTVTDNDGAAGFDTMIVTATDSGDGGGGGCTYNPHNKSFDLMFIFMMMMSLFYPLRRKYLR
ncbi:MAG: hypothetical protein P794_07855 [Epsilonproteobacteria bacterium (ex Lamellibrachia satsuma)]|nr:MAG: hypothetical protein P794_07855 [Epsilonproteobacteria bacterium (ex Lamellibrachia satsuma)]